MIQELFAEEGAPLMSGDLEDEARERGISKERYLKALVALGFDRQKMIGEGGPWYWAPMWWFRQMSELKPDLIKMPKSRATGGGREDHS